MTEGRWARLEGHFEEGMGLDDAGRAALVERVRAEDPSLGEELERLLRHDARGSDPLGDAVLGAMASMVDRAGPDRRGARLGAYRILDELGHGGMGTVYLAERADDAYEARVAIKLVRGGVASREQVRRFRGERQILAGLGHPNIARLLDGGATPDGLPYVVMELVDGEPIDTWCDRERLPLRERVRLFLSVCDAVAYAHRNLVVHRDLKPGNILVDRDGVPKLLDFGIAKLVEPDADGSGETRTALAMTPAYASPEQVRGEAVTTATDVYALGAVLYELLTGRPAHRFETRTPGEIERVVCRADPDRPSTAVTRTWTSTRGESPTPEELGGARRTDPARLRHALEGDLDTIVLTALRKEPERRYPSVEALAQDLSAWLVGLPVAARGDSWRYRGGKFVARHRAGLAGAALVAVTLVGLVTFYTLRLAEERDRARLEATKAETLADYLFGLFTIEDRSPALGAAVTARELLDRGVETLETLEEPEVRADLMFSLGSAYDNLGLFDRATPLLRESEAIIRGLRGEYDPETSATRAALADNLWERGEYAASDSVLRAALPGFADEPLQYASTLANRGRALQRLNRWDEARTAYEEALERYEGMDEDTREQRAVALSTLGQIALITDDREEAERLTREALALDRELDTEGRGSLSNTLQSLGAILVSRRELDEAEGHLEESLSIEEVNLGPEHPDLAPIVNQLSALHLLRGEAESALPYAERAVALGRGRGEDHADLAYDLVSLAQVQTSLERFDEARATAAEAVRMSRATDGPDSPFLARAIQTAGVVELDAGNVPEALVRLDEAVAIAEGALPEGHTFTGNLRFHRARARREAGDVDGAEADFLATWRSYTDAFGPDEERVKRVAAELAELYDEAGRLDEAARWRREAGDAASGG